MNRIAAMAESGLDAIIAYDGAGILIYANPAALKLCGFAHVEALADAGLPRFRRTDGVERTLLQSLEAGPFHEEAFAITAGGRQTPCLVSANVLAGDGVAPVLYYAFVRDVTEMHDYRRRLELQNLQLAAVDRAKSAFFATVSHELRTPLNAIIGFADLLARERFGPLSDRYRDYARQICDSGLTLLQSVNHILDMVEIEAGRLELREETVDLATAMNACLAAMEGRAREAGLALQGGHAAPLPRLCADSRMVKHIMFSLVGNALKFTPRGGRVSVRAEADRQGGLSIVIGDSGVGIPAELMAQVTPPFGQIDGSLARPSNGAGLGLPLAKAFIERHGGSLGIDSEPGRGTEVRVRFPPHRVLQPRTAAE